MFGAFQSGVLAQIGGKIKTYATLDPTAKAAGITLSNGNLTASSAAANVAVFATIGKEISEGGAWYIEATINTLGANNTRIFGVANKDQLTSQYPGFTIDGLGIHMEKTSGTGSIWTAIYNGAYNGSDSTFVGDTIGAGDVIGILIDLTADTISARLNGATMVKFPVGATVALSTIANNYSGAVKKIYPDFAFLTSASQVTTVNFGATPFAFTVPAGANAGWYTEA